MRHALALASEAGRVGEVPVGAVVVAGEEIIGRGANRTISDSDPTAHAEIVALRDAAARIGNYRLVGASLFSTIEPCTMCAGAMIHARVERLYFGAREPKAGAAGSASDVFSNPRLNHRIVVEGGVLEAEAGELLSTFFRARRG
ncbi:MAG TPA: tRNA adenosine(34) deaminase TadA [Pseudomonadales bacterium]|nr:tRNA adenosine(34) deaminase TadA [Pseudomonadales bacterium]